MKKTILATALTTIALTGCGIDEKIEISNYSGQNFLFVHTGYSDSDLDNRVSEYQIAMNKVGETIRKYGYEYDNALTPQDNVIANQDKLAKRLNVTKEKEALLEEISSKRTDRKPAELLEIENKLKEAVKMAAIELEIPIQERLIDKVYEVRYDSDRCSYFNRAILKVKSETGCAQGGINLNMMRLHPEMAEKIKPQLQSFVESYLVFRDEQHKYNVAYSKTRNELKKDNALANLKYGEPRKLKSTIESINDEIESANYGIEFDVYSEEFNANSLESKMHKNAKYTTQFVAYVDGQNVYYKNIAEFGEDFDVADFKLADANSWKYIYMMNREL